MLNIEGMKVTDKKEDYGFSYTFLDGDNKIKLSITELTFDELVQYSHDLRDFEVYQLMSDYPVNTIIGFDWEIELGKENVNLRKIFRTMEVIGKDYAKNKKPDIIYYAYEDKRIHKY
jgi:ABC-type antimicrobial peptide transport system permease subunit